MSAVPEATAAVLEMVAEERERQRQKWGAQHHCTVEWTTILTEEVGESAKEALAIHFHPTGETAQLTDAEYLNRLSSAYVAELVQSAAVAVAAVEDALYGSA